MTVSIARRMVRCNRPTCTKCPHGPYYSALVTTAVEPSLDLLGLERELHRTGIGGDVRISQRTRGNWLLSISLNREAVESREREQLKMEIGELLEKNRPDAGEASGHRA